MDHRRLAARPVFHRGIFQRLAACVGSACPLCEGPARAGRLCEPCAADVRAGMLAEPRCVRCALLAPARGSRADCGCPLAGAPFVRTVAAFDYAPPADMLVWRLKSRMRLEQARALAGLLADCVREQAWPHAGPWVLVPVPAGRTSLARRGFNPAAEIAQGLSRELAWPVRTAWLARARDPRDAVKQSRLDRHGRRLAAEGAYEASHQVLDRRIALVDDVMTTGATACAAAQALLDAGAREVVVLVAARTPPARPAWTLAQ